MTRLIVGEAPGRLPSVPDEPLSGRSGQRLAELCGLDLPTYLARFECINVLPTFPGAAGKGARFTLREAVPAARERVVTRYALGGAVRAVLLGRAALAVERALLEMGFRDARDLSFTNFVWHHVRVPGGFAAFACCPHPSGVNRWWNDPSNLAEARRFWCSFSTKARS